MVYTKVVEKIKTHFMFNKFFSKNRTIYEILKNMVETEGPQMASQYGTYVLHAGKARLHARARAHTHTHKTNK